jgi:Zn-finger nucleic acid-binding protein
VNCPSCGAPITQRPDTDGYKCDYCHKVYYPGAEDDQVIASEEVADPSLACPICSLPLVKATVAKIPALFCTECHGLLMPMQALQAAIEELRSVADGAAVQAPPDRGDLKRVVRCPKCSQRMDTHFYAGPGNVIVDSCDGCCLIWLDRGEITRVAHAPDESEPDAMSRF